jgi:hypothetical protein
LQIRGGEPSAVIRLLGTSNGQPWEIAEWLKADGSGGATAAGVFAEGTEGTYTLTVEIGDLKSNTLSFVVSNCKSLKGQ